MTCEKAGDVQPDVRAGVSCRIGMFPLIILKSFLSAYPRSSGGYRRPLLDPKMFNLRRNLDTGVEIIEERVQQISVCMFPTGNRSSESLLQVAEMLREVTTKRDRQPKCTVLPESIGMG